jgi:hypothetical protein
MGSFLQLLIEHTWKFLISVTPHCFIQSSPHYGRALRSRQKLIVGTGRESDDAHAHFSVAKHFLFHIYKPTGSHPRVVCLCIQLVIDKVCSSFPYYAPNVVVEWLTLLIREVPGSNLGPSDRLS